MDIFSIGFWTYPVRDRIAFHRFGRFVLRSGHWLFSRILIISTRGWFFSWIWIMLRVWVTGFQKGYGLFIEILVLVFQMVRKTFEFGYWICLYFNVDCNTKKQHGSDLRNSTSYESAVVFYLHQQVANKTTAFKKTLRRYPCFLCKCW